LSDFGPEIDSVDTFKSRQIVVSKEIVFDYAP